MQRNLLKIALICSITILLAALPAPSLYAAQNAAETDTQNEEASQQRETYYVNAQNGLKMRSAPSKESDVVTLLPHGATVTVIGTALNGWCEIEYSGESGYVAEKYITKSDEDDAETDTDTSDSDESIPSTQVTSEGLSATLGATPVIFALIAAIIIMILLAVFTAYSFLKKENPSDDTYSEDDYDDDDNNDDYNNDGYHHDDYNEDDYDYVSSDDEEYENTDDGYYDEEYYEEEE